MFRALFRRRRRATHTDWFRPSGTPPPDRSIDQVGKVGSSESPDRASDSFVETLVEGDPDLEATLGGVRGLRDEGRESIRRRYVQLADLRDATVEDLLALSGIGQTTAAALQQAARDVTSLQVKGLREDALAALAGCYRSVGALATADVADLTELPGIGPATAERLLKAARGSNGQGPATQP